MHSVWRMQERWLELGIVLVAKNHSLKVMTIAKFLSNQVHISVTRAKPG